MEIRSELSHLRCRLVLRVDRGIDLGDTVVIGADLIPLLAASVELAALRKENRELRQENARLRAERMNFDLSADSVPCFHRKQI